MKKTKGKVKDVKEKMKVVKVDLDYITIAKIALWAHEKDITFNEMCNLILKEEMEKLEKGVKHDK
ncbi:MAG: hypothetical protein PHF86_13560 [Candidatus Nanoarchaeia archaeon]|nr:hypothetical protein [Candidatus Nanoarchaeia archaeon]